MADGGDTQASIIIKTISRIDEIDPLIWNTVANPSTLAYNPFISFAFLDALEKSQSVCSEAGWTPMHMVIEKNDQIIGVAPLYAKGHSQGEYIFDHHWADAYHRAGGHYYPKLLCASPFTPAQGPRLLTNDDATRAILANGLTGIAKKFGVSSLHVNFILDRDEAILQQHGFSSRISSQYHWFNKGYVTFDNFLNDLSSRKRKTIKRERRQAIISGLTVKHLRGNEITSAHWDAFWNFYQDTGARKWGSPYLTRLFFDLIADSMNNDLLLIIAERDGVPIAGALNFIGGDALYGRYWGCAEDHPFLHFEICYYQAIDFAIANRLQRVEAGAQGEHKLARGYEPVATKSAHWIRDPGFRNAVDQYLESERVHGEAEIEALKNFTPYKKDG